MENGLKNTHSRYRELLRACCSNPGGSRVSIDGSRDCEIWSDSRYILVVEIELSERQDGKK